MTVEQQQEMTEKYAQDQVKEVSVELTSGDALRGPCVDAPPLATRPEAFGGPVLTGALAQAAGSRKAKKGVLPRAEAELVMNAYLSPGAPVHQPRAGTGAPRTPAFKSSTAAARTPGFSSCAAAPSTPAPVWSMGGGAGSTDMWSPPAPADDAVSVVSVDADEAEDEVIDLQLIM